MRLYSHIKNNNMIIVFTGVHYGGMLQFTNQLVNTLNESGHKAIAFIPQAANLNNVNDVIFYQNHKTLNLYSDSITCIIDKIVSFKPSKVVFAEESLICCEVLLRLQQDIDTILTIHDAHPHPSNTLNLLNYIKSFIKSTYIKNAYKKATKLLFMSESTRNDFIQDNKKFISKSLLLPLGAHIPKVLPKRPKDLQFPENFILFFGRIDKYKGLGILLNVFLKNCEQIALPLVIAGKGNFTEEESHLIKEIPANKICVINRYISDEEMIWLFQKSSFLCLPYIEASQSGIIPIAYYFGKTVVVSNIKGLTQFVQNEKTGFIYNTEEELISILIKLSNKQYSSLKDNIENYYSKYLDWKNNIKAIINYD